MGWWPQGIRSSCCFHVCLSSTLRTSQGPSPSAGDLTGKLCVLGLGGPLAGQATCAGVDGADSCRGRGVGGPGMPASEIEAAGHQVSCHSRQPREHSSFPTLFWGEWRQPPGPSPPTWPGHKAGSRPAPQPVPPTLPSPTGTAAWHSHPTSRRHCSLPHPAPGLGSRRRAAGSGPRASGVREHPNVYGGRASWGAGPGADAERTLRRARVARGWGKLRAGAVLAGLAGTQGPVLAPRLTEHSGGGLGPRRESLGRTLGAITGCGTHTVH